jgi:hypothetical protein
MIRRGRLVAMRKPLRMKDLTIGSVPSADDFSQASDG